jgi:hypothetical protein
MSALNSLTSRVIVESWSRFEQIVVVLELLQYVTIAFYQFPHVNIFMVSTTYLGVSLQVFINLFLSIFVKVVQSCSAS